jgi:hypothetical protein
MLPLNGARQSDQVPRKGLASIPLRLHDHAIDPFQEAEDKTIDLSDNERAVVKLLIQYLYEAEHDPVLPTDKTNPSDAILLQTISHSCVRNANGHHCSSDAGQLNCKVCPHHTCGNSCQWDCDDFWCMDCFTVGDAEQLLLHAKMYEIADKYDIAGLKNLCIEKYKRACREFWDDPKFAESAHHVYCTTPSRDKGLRNIVTKTLSDHMSLLEKPEIEDLMTKFNGLAFGLLFDKAKQSGWCNK